MLGATTQMTESVVVVVVHIFVSVRKAAMFSSKCHDMLRDNGVSLHRSNSENIRHSF